VDIVAEGVVIGGRYRVGRLLGRGGMAEVYDAYDQRLARRVAVKLLRPELAAHPGVRRRFEAEARAAARLSHPNVVAVHDTGEDDGRAYIVMERLPGETLADRLAAEPGHVDQGWLRQIAVEVLAALGAAHGAGIVHRDVKPSNILLAQDGRAKVADFGIAKTTEGLGGSSGQDRDLTAVGVVIGTPAYLAPERLDGRVATPQSDLYAVGVILYEGLTGRQPFAGTTPLSVAYMVRHEPPPDPRQIRPDADPQLVAVIAQAMAYDPEARFRSARDMAGALGSVGAATAATAAGAATVAMAAPIPGARAQPVSAPTMVIPRRPPPGRRRRRRHWLPILAALAAFALGLGAVLLARQGQGKSLATSTSTTRPVATSAKPTTTAAATTTAAPPPTTDPVTAQLEAVANQLTAADGSRASQLQSGLLQVAALPAGSQERSQAATTLLAQATNWSQHAQLSSTAFQQASAALVQAGATKPKHKGGPGGNG
jgi:tRNA A-37 threonylcarbamoyl transferase component Bud32